MDDMRVTVEERRPTVAEYSHLRAAVGWSVPAESLVAAALDATTVAAVAVVDGVAVGMGRVRRCALLAPGRSGR